MNETLYSIVKMYPDGTGEEISDGLAFKDALYLLEVVDTKNTNDKIYFDMLSDEGHIECTTKTD